MDHETFLKEIIAEPENDFPRLVYADWLEERGDVRSEFIRAQCELPKLDPTDDRWWELKVREQVLLREHRQRWFPETPRAVKLKHAEYERGFVHHLNVGLKTWQKHHNKLATASPLNSLQIRADGLQLQRFCEVGIPESIQSLQLLKGQNVTPFQLQRVLKSLPEGQLRGLHLSHVTSTERTTWNNLLSVSTLEGLRLLDLSYPEERRTSDGQQVNLAIKQMPNIESLNLSGFGVLLHQNSYPSSVWKTLLKSHWPSQLRELYLDQVDDRGFAELLQTGLLPRLEVLSLAGSGELTAFNSKVDLPQLKSLNLSGNMLRHHKKGWLSSTLIHNDFPELHTLDLSHNGFRKVDFRLLSKTRSLPNLRRLNLSHNDFDDGALRQLLEGTLLGQLRELHLAGNPCTPHQRHFTVGRSVEHFANCPLISNLVHLNLSLQPLRDEHLLALTHSPHLQNLRSLDIGWTSITEDAVKKFVKSDKLNQLVMLNPPARTYSQQTRSFLRERFGAGLNMTLNTGWSES